MKIFSRDKIREADAYTIAHEPVKSIDLMERAAKACTKWLLKKYGIHYHYFIICGNGNNGGDGMALARLLAQAHCSVEVYLARVSQNDSDDFKTNLNALLSQGKVSVREIHSAEEIELHAGEKPVVVLDAVFGSGLTREPEGFSADVIDRVNGTGLPVVAVDIPSGLYCDDNSENSYTHVIRAAHTLSFQQPKLAFLFAENYPYCGKFEVLDIGIHPNYMVETPADFYYLTHEMARSIVKPRAKFSHKGSFGHALVAAGSFGKTGAAVLATRACLHAGAGLVTVFAPRCSVNILQAAVPEAMVTVSDEENHLGGQIFNGNYSAVGVGPGIGNEKETENALKQLIQDCGAPLVLDADALNILSENKTWLSFLKPGTILTPHPGEFDRLTEKSKLGYERMLLQKEMAVRYKIFIVLKGAHTSIACPDGAVYFNSSGNPGMATGGSGDALTGIITALRAQGYDPLQASLLGVYVHGLAADITASVQTQQGMSSGDIIDNLGGAWRMLLQ